MSNNLIKPLLLLAIMTSLLSCRAFALTLQFVDQNNQPISNVVVEVFISDISLNVMPKKAQPHIMDQIDKAFLPALLVIQKGDQVEFPNSDNIRHHVYSFSKAKPFELKLYSGRSTQPLSFDNHGVVVLGCNIHDSMVGFIYIADSAFQLISNSQGLVELDQTVSISRLTAWHSQQSGSPEKAKLIEVKQFGSTSKVPHKIVIELAAPTQRDTFGAKFRNES